MSNDSGAIHRRGIGLAALLVLLLAALGLGFSTVRAQEQVSSPELTGSISGQVVDGESMQPLPNIDVTVYGGLYGSFTAYGTTDDAGRYRIENLPSGLYRVGFASGDQPYVPLYYPFADELRAGFEVAVNADDVTGIDVQMQLGGIVTGTVALVDGVNLSYAYVEIYRPDGAGDWRSFRSDYVNAEPDAPEITYVVSGLAEGVYRIGAFTYAGSSTYSEYFDNAASLDTATNVTVTQGAVTPAINFVLGAGEDGGEIRGQVTAAEDGRPLPDITVRTFISSTSGWSTRSSPRTDAVGAYRLRGLDIGYYAICVEDQNRRYASQCYAQSGSLQSATPISVTNGAVISDVNFTMQRNGALEGQVRLSAPTPDNPYFYGRVIAYLADGSTYYEVAQDAIGGSVNDTAFFLLDALPPGRYRLLATVFQGSEYIAEYFADAVTLASATDVTVTAGATTPQINFELGENPGYGVIRGNVRTPTGDDLAQVRVTASLKQETDRDPLHSAITMANGSYEIKRLLPGVYRVCFSDLQSLHFPTCYDNAEPDGASPITVTMGAQVNGIDAVLRPAAAISGTISATDDLVRDLDGLTLYKLSIDGYWLWNKYVSLSSSEVLTRSYLLAPLEEGVYRLGLSFSNNAGYHVIYYQHAGAIDSATDIELANGEHRDDIDFVLPDSANARIEGRVTFHGAPQGGIRVDVSTLGGYGDVLLYVFTDEQGEFVVNGLLPDAYYLHFVDPTAVIAPYYYGGTTPYDRGEAVILLGGTVATNVNMDLGTLEFTPYVSDRLFMPLILQ